MLFVVKVLFIHRSVGQNMLEDSKLRYKLESDGVQLYDVNANKCRFTNSEGFIEESPVPIQEGKTDPEDLAEFFSKAQEGGYEPALNEFDCIIIKSCYTANSLKTDKRLDSQIDAYVSIKKYIENHSRQNFIICTAPPQTQICTTAKAAKRAKTLQGWIIRQFDTLPNVKVLDVFGMLASERGVLDKKYRRFAFYDQHPNRDGSRLVAAELERMIKNLRQSQKQPSMKSVT